MGLFPPLREDGLSGSPPPQFGGLELEELAGRPEELVPEGRAGFGGLELEEFAALGELERRAEFAALGTLEGRAEFAALGELEGRAEFA